MRNSNNTNQRRTYGNTPPPVKLNMYEGTTAQDAVPKIKAMLGERVKVVEIVIHPDSMSFQAQDPQNPENVDLYMYDASGLMKGRAVGLGSVLGPSSKNFKLEDFLFNLDDVNLAVTPELAQKSLERIDVENKRIASMTISRGGWGSFVFGDKDVKWEVSVWGKRKSGYVTYDLKGKEKKVNINDNPF